MGASSLLSELHELWVWADGQEHGGSGFFINSGISILRNIALVTLLVVRSLRLKGVIDSIDTSRALE